MPDSSFFTANRTAIFDKLENGSIALLFAGHAPRQSADAYYPFFANRNFVYLTGADGEFAQDYVLLAAKHDNRVSETLFITPCTEMIERWQGKRLKPEEAVQITGIAATAPLDELPLRLHRLFATGKYASLWLDLERFTPSEPDGAVHLFAQQMLRTYPHLALHDIYPLIRSKRTVKHPQEIEAMKKAMAVTRKGILAMMRASRPGMREYEYKAIFDSALTSSGVLAPAFPPIISAGENNFYIHYHSYTGTAKDGDMILNDVGACWDGLCNDVSRGWPANGTFSPRQSLLYTCAYNTSEYMFSILKPGIPMADVDLTARKYCFEQLKAIGLCSAYEDVGKYMWHGGAHHVGYDVHDAVDMTLPLSPGMVFCVDIGIYCREWGIGFRLEDNCLITGTGCENLSKDIPRSMEDIENAMKDK